jgi:hypothetical protein
VLRTDVKSYYASIDHMLLLDRLALWVRDPFILNLPGQYMRRTAERGGSFWDYERGISLGCPLSPLIGAFFLDELDRRMSETGRFYIRFMDDILVLAPTRWKLRRAMGIVNEILGALPDIARSADRASERHPRQRQRRLCRSGIWRYRTGARDDGGRARGRRHTRGLASAAHDRLL